MQVRAFESYIPLITRGPRAIVKALCHFSGHKQPEQTQIRGRSVYVIKLEVP